MRLLSQALTARKTWLAVSLVCAASLAASAWRAAARPRAWAVGTVPVAFWVWRDALPAPEVFERAISETRARVLFVRAGQLHVEGGRVSRVRAPVGKFPCAAPLHLVYNGTHALLNLFEQLDTTMLASSVAETYRADLARAEDDGASVAGLQLDLDVPTRLLPRYAVLLRVLRAQLPPGTQLSVTGLPTWMSSRDLPPVLDACDFWVPQFYGARVPERLEEAVPVSSPATISRDITRARQLDRPFYAGLAAYGYAALYSNAGALVELRGDLDPDAVARDPSFELIERRAFEPNADDSGAATPSEWRYVFRAERDAALEGLNVRAGDELVLDVPSAETLRPSLRAVRTEAGARLLGVCLFRLPADDDRTALTLAQVVAALADRGTRNATTFHVGRDDASNGVESGSPLRFKLVNNGEAGALLGGDAMTATICVPAGSLRGVVSLENLAGVETLCGAEAGGGALEPCSARRADAVRLRASAWRPGARAAAVLSVAGVPAQLPVTLSVRLDDGRVWQQTTQVLIEGGRF